MCGYSPKMNFERAPVRLTQLLTSPRLRGEVGMSASSALIPGEGASPRVLSLWKGPLTPTLSPQAGRGSSPRPLYNNTLHLTRCRQSRLGRVLHQFIDNDGDNFIAARNVDFLSHIKFQPHPPGNDVRRGSGFGIF